jgi:hypothetical protein
MKGPILGEHPCITFLPTPGSGDVFVTNSEQNATQTRALGAIPIFDAENT